MSFIKQALEKTLFAGVFRAARDELRFARRTRRVTPFGFRFSGSKPMQDGSFEPDEVRTIQKHFSAADIFVDIGANIGYFSCIACQSGVKTIAFEPIPDNLRYLYDNIWSNNWQEKIEVFPVGLAEKPGLAECYGASTGASLLKGWAGVSSSFKQKIAVSSLDTILGNRLLGKRVVVKMDVEGAEFPALLGARALLESQPKPVWMVEIILSEHRDNESNPNFMATFDLFLERNYRVFEIGGSEKELSREEIQEYVKSDTHSGWARGNYLFTGKD